MSTNREPKETLVHRCPRKAGAKMRTKSKRSPFSDFESFRQCQPHQSADLATSMDPTSVSFLWARLRPDVSRCQDINSRMSGQLLAMNRLLTLDAVTQTCRDRN